MPITGQIKMQIRSRLGKALGHLNAVCRMVEDEKYCVDILNQLKAVQSALDRSAELMLKQHLETCVVEAVKADDSARVMEELWQLLRKDNHLAKDVNVKEQVLAGSNHAGCCE